MGKAKKLCIYQHKTQRAEMRIIADTAEDGERIMTSLLGAERGDWSLKVVRDFYETLADELGNKFGNGRLV